MMAVAMAHQGQAKRTTISVEQPSTFAALALVVPPGTWERQNRRGNAVIRLRTDEKYSKFFSYVENCRSFFSYTKKRRRSKRSSREGSLPPASPSSPPSGTGDSAPGGRSGGCGTMRRVSSGDRHCALRDATDVHATAAVAAAVAVAAAAPHDHLHAAHLLRRARPPARSSRPEARGSLAENVAPPFIAKDSSPDQRSGYRMQPNADADRCCSLTDDRPMF